MKVLDLRCANEHRFEGWFASDEDFAAQGERGLVACPMCDDKAILRMPSAPRLNVSARRAETAFAESGAAAEAARARLQARWLHAARALLAGTEDVGQRFPEEARRIHYGEAEDRSIRGSASSADAEALREEGIEVFAMPLPEALKGTVQ